MPLLRAHIIWPIVATAALVAAIFWYVRVSRPDLSELALPAIPPAASVQKPKGVFGLRCEGLSATPDAPAGSSVRRTEAELYLAIIQSAPHTKDSPPVVELVSMPIPRRQSAPGFDKWNANAHGMAAAGLFECVTLTPDRFPTGTRLVALADIPRDYDALAAKFDGARQSFAFSRARIDEERGDAVVYYERLCRDCGIAEWVWFRRDRPGEPWRIEGRVWGWIN